MVMFEPIFRYNFISNDQGSYGFIPYIKGGFNFGLIDNTDELSDLSLGGNIGAGIAYSFRLFEECWMIDLNGNYYGANTLYRKGSRELLETININFNISYRL